MLYEHSRTLSGISKLAILPSITTRYGRAHNGRLPMQLDARQLEILLAVSRTGSLTAAARLLNLSQPGVSAAIAHLERSAGAKLLDRGRHGAAATRTGAVLIRWAEALEHVLAQAQKELDLQEHGVAGMLTIAGTPGALMSLVPGALQEMRKHYPGFELRVREAQDGELIELLRSMRADLTISTVGIETVAPDIEEVTITHDAFELVVAHNHPLRAQVVSLKDLRDYAWVLPAASGAFRRHIDALFLGAEVRMPDDVVLCDSLSTTKEIVRRAHYMTILPATVVASEVKGGALRTIQIRQRLVTRALGVRYLRTPAVTPIAHAFVNALRKSFSSPVP